MPRRTLEICAWCSSATWCEIRGDGKPQCGGCKAVAFFRWLYKHIDFTVLPWQEKVLRDLYGACDIDTGQRRYRRSYLSMAKKNGKALGLETPIPTPDGWQTIGGIRSGARVFDERGIPCTVVGITETMVGRPCFRVKFSDGCEIVADAEHEWLTMSRLPSFRVGAKRQPCVRIRTTQEIADSIRIESPGSSGSNHSIRVCGALALPDAALPVPPYVLGAWLGDGTSSIATITVHPDDLEIISQIEKEGITCDRFKSGGFAKSAHSYRLGKSAIPDTGLKNTRDGSSFQALLGRLELLNNKHIPAVYLRASIHQRMALLQGLMDTDGYATKGGQCEFTTTSEALAKQAAELIRSLGLKPTTKRGEAKLYGRVIGPKWRIQFWSRADAPCFRLRRKCARLKKAAGAKKLRSTTRHIVSVESVPSEPVRCIQVDSPSHLFLAGESMIPTHNSFFIAGMPLYHITSEGVDRPEAYGAAAARDQAGLVFSAAARLVRANPTLRERLTVLDSTKRIVRKDKAGFYAVLSADGGVNDGIEPSLGLIDELHRWRTLAADTLYKVITKGTLSRAEPHVAQITTAGEIYSSQICHREYEFAKQVLAGTVESKRFYAAIWEADSSKVQIEPEYWKSREARVAANPSHEDLGGFLRDEAIVEELNKAIAVPAEQTDYLRLNLNVWVQNETRAIDLAQWDACPKPWEAEGWVGGDYGLSKEFTDRFIERECWIGVDLSASTDLTAVVLVFPTDDGKLEIVPFCWTTEKALRQLDHLRRLVDGGFLEVVEGNLIDYDLIAERIRWASRMFNLREVVFDPWNDKGVASSLIKDGFTCIEVPQTYAQMSQPTKQFLDQIAAGTIIHGGHPLLRWCADCLTLVRFNDNVRPSKPDRGKSSKRIDAIVAAIMGASRAVRPEVSVYETRGIQTI